MLGNAGGGTLRFSSKLSSKALMCIFFSSWRPVLRMRGSGAAARPWPDAAAFLACRSALMIFRVEGSGGVGLSKQA